MNAPSTVRRRPLRFATIDDLLREIERVVEADKHGRVRALGSWTPGQVLGHLAAWIEYGYDGYPMKPPPWFVRLFLRWQVKKYLRQAMPSGVRIPKVAEGTYGTEVLSTEVGTDRLRRALHRLQEGELAK